MIYLLDASAIITAKDVYYQHDRVPEYWNWLASYSRKGIVKIPFEIFGEVKPNDTKDLFHKWLVGMKNEFVLDEKLNAQNLRTVLNEYASDLSDVELAECNNDAILLSYAFKIGARTIVTAEASKPSWKRANRQVPDVCKSLGIESLHWTQLTRTLDFKTTNFRSK
jgi:Domain of unknown function (DUF4411)